MKKIKFSHRYIKLKETFPGEPLSLVQVWNTNTRELMPEFLDYDTAYVENGKIEHYKLGFKGDCMVLFFIDSGGTLFTTIRRATPTKTEYYNTAIGCSFKLEINVD